MGGGGGSQRLLSFNPTKVMVVLLLGLWLLLGCENNLSHNNLTGGYYGYQTHSLDTFKL